MRVIIAGCRDFPVSMNSYEILKKAIEDSKFTITKVISGGAPGVDSLGELYAERNNIDLEIYRADWDSNGKAAGPIRNRKMAENADALIAIWDGKSKGTKNMIETANKMNLKVYVRNFSS